MRLAQPGRKATGLDALVLATVGAVTPSAHACECVAAGAAAASGTARSAVRAGLIAAWALALLLAAPPIARAATDTERVERVLAQTPLIDGHNDLPWEIRARFGGDLVKIDLAASTAALPAPPDGAPLMTDIPRLRVGRVGAQFWSVWIPAATRGPEAVQMTLEQIDLVKALCARYPADLAMAYTAADIVRVHKAHRIAALIGVEGGHQINNSLAVLRAYYDGGARYMTLTHSSNTDWADSATDTPAHHGLTPFGREVVREMNRLGMLVDLAHVSADTMRAALTMTEAPVIFSHSSARALVDHPRDVPDDVLELVAKNGGVVMVNFFPGYVSEARRRWDADRAAEQARYSSPPFGGLYIGQPERIAAALRAWEQAHLKPPVVLADVADHIEHIRRVAGVDHVGIGSDFDGIPEAPVGLEGVDKFPALLAELARRGWSDAELAKVAGANLLRVMGQAEAVSARLRAARPPSLATLATLDQTPALPGPGAR
ncbi:MAG: membrane dipeptidase [Gammaproteobacteria bacterium]|nr:MAG: membrane dipeptidase [Gammaproteobacteria bacterium]